MTLDGISVTAADTKYRILSVYAYVSLLSYLVIAVYTVLHNAGRIVKFCLIL